MLYVHHMHILVCRMFKWNYEQLLYGQTFLPTDIRFARANAPLKNWSVVSEASGNFFGKLCTFPQESSKFRSDYLFSFQKRTDYLFPRFLRSEYLFPKSARPPLRIKWSSPNWDIYRQKSFAVKRRSCNKPISEVDYVHQRLHFFKNLLYTSTL